MPNPLIESLDDRGVAVITLNRPERHNAFDDRVIAALSASFQRLADNPRVRVLLLCGSGKSFSAGADIAWMQRMADYDYGHNLDDARALASMLHALKTLPMPTVARVQGSALGGALGLIACCDIAIAANSATFGLTEARIGLVPATIGPYIVESIGARWSRRLFLSGERFSAARAQELQLVHDVCEVEHLDQRVETVLGELLACSPQAQRAAKELLSAITGRPINEAMRDDTSARIAQLRVSPEGQEGLRAFLHKRRPNWVSAGDAC